MIMVQEYYRITVDAALTQDSIQKNTLYKKNTKKHKKMNNYRKEERNAESMVRNITVTIFYPDDLYYGEIKVKTFKNFPPLEEEIMDEVERRLPFFKGKKYSISIN